ncbi:MAG: SAM-dependent methyltransferase [Desulfobacteraceae bacterium 4572_88]|nr:MAG: SAM-dependent methyltransferase [Desulfobacteraceae bacterium 4572_88]
MRTLWNKIKEPGSFRDPAGFLFYREGSICRQINQVYKENYEHLMNSGLYAELAKDGLLIPHEETDIADAVNSDKAHQVIRPEKISFISYPYEWCFSQLKDAALATLTIQKRAFAHGMSLKDASAYNIQFRKGRPILIDTLSFERYQEGSPWAAYRQFCQHFLAPLVLMAFTDIRLGQLLRVHIDGIPLDLASRLLPSKTRLRFALLSHIHLHAKSQKYFAGKRVRTAERKISHASMLGLIDNLEGAVRKLKWQPGGTEWDAYYEDTNYSAESLDEKENLVANFLEQSDPKSVWDLGANTGRFSRIASEKGIPTLSFDIDPACVERNYLEVVGKKESHLLPLLLDLTNPSPGMGWNHQERSSLRDRGPADTMLALALIHHLAISNNVPLERLADFFASLCCSLIIEFVPKEDSQVQRLLFSREDVFPNYTQEAFEDAFKVCFTIRDRVKIPNTQRTLYLMKKNPSEK